MILYIEDNKAIAENVIKYLEVEWYTVKRCADGQEGLNAWLSWRYDCVILDVMLPWVDGFTICRELRAKKQVPIIMTTAKGELSDKGEWFEWWTDDYLVKPFDLPELVMRLGALINRSQVSDIIRIDDVEFILDENRCIKAGAEVKLTLKERQILIELLSVPGRTVSRADIVEAVWWWDALFESEKKLDVYMTTIRRKIGKKTIETVKGYGYKMHVE